MPTLSRRQHVRLCALAAAVFAFAPGRDAFAADQPRKVSIESLLYDLKSPDPARRQTAARELGVARHKPAIPQLIPLAQDQVASVRREVELTFERMRDIAVLDGLLTLAADVENDIRARAVDALVDLHLPHTE